MIVEVAGTWEMGWSAPVTEINQWWAVMRSYEIPMLHMTPVSGVDHKMVTEHKSYEDMLAATQHLTPVFVHEDAEVELKNFIHPMDALYVFGKANLNPFNAYGKDGMAVRIDVPTMGMFWPHQALAIVMHDRGDL